MTDVARRVALRLFGLLPLLLGLVLVAAVGLRSERFLTADNALQIATQAAPTIVVATGMTFVLLLGGVDLSVGAVMFIGAGLAGQMALAGYGVPAGTAAMVLTGLLGGVVNALLVTRLRLLGFVATLATLYIGRGLGRWITETRAINLPDAFGVFGADSWLGLPVAVWIALLVATLGQIALSATPFGRQLYALGFSAESARKVGVRIDRISATAYVVCGVCAGIGGLLALSRLGAVSPRFGELYEFDAITACVLGGTSLHGGQGRVLPGAVVGAVLLRTIYSALVSVQADPYLYPLVTAALIFLAVLTDAVRVRLGDALTRRYAA